MLIILVNLEKNYQDSLQPRKQGYPSMIVKDLPLVFLKDKIEVSCFHSIPEDVSM